MKKRTSKSQNEKLKIERSGSYGKESAIDEPTNDDGKGGAEEQAEEQLKDVVPSPAESEPERKTYERQSVQRHAKEKAIRPDFERIVETTFDINMHEVAERIKASLSVGAKRSEHGFLHRAVDDSNMNAYDGWRLALAAEIEFKRWELQNQPVFAKMWNDAEEQLVAEGAKKATLTNKAIEMRISTNHPDEWVEQEVKRLTYKNAVTAMERLAKEAGDRPASLRVMLDKIRG